MRADDEPVLLESRRHGIVLAGPLARASGLALAGVVALVLLPWPASVASPVLIGVAAFLALRSVWRWEATRVVVTRERLLVSTGILRRREATVRFARLGPVEIEQSLLGRLLGYGTVVAGELEITHVPQPTRIVDRLS
jgi:uncharacterized membrane protein YdbT with pleckstrin-like domain